MRPQYEKVPSAGLGLFVYRRMGGSFPFYWHYHPEFELTLIEKGSGQRMVGNSICDYGPGDLVLLGPNLPHTWSSSESHARAGKHCQSAIVIQFSSTFFGRDLLQRDEMKPLAELLSAARCGLHFPGVPHRGVWRQMTALLKLDGARRTVALLSLLLDLALENKSVPLASGGLQPLVRVADERRMNRICLYLRKHSRDAIDYADLARHAAMDRTALCRFFKRTGGRTMGEYVNEIRLSEAVRLLSESDMSILDISQLVGFPNYANFCRQFKSSRGESPMAIRKRFRTAPEAVKLEDSLG